MKKNKIDYEDDGRTIVDMSMVERPNLYTFRNPHPDKSKIPSSNYQETYTNEQRRWAVFGALKASMLIALAYIIGIGIIILILVLWFNR